MKRLMVMAMTLAVSSGCSGVGRFIRCTADCAFPDETLDAEAANPPPADAAPPEPQRCPEKKTRK
jgi:hypothetical protein